MSQPLGSALGTACEVRATLEVLSGAGDPRLRELTLRLAAEAMVLRGHDPVAARRRLEQALGDGTARERWDRLVVAHGGDPNPGRMAEPAARHDVAAATSGVVTAIDGERLGWVAVEVGAGRRTRDEDLAHGAGVLLRARLGDRVEEGQPLATVLAGDRSFDPARVVDRVRGAFVIGDGPVAVQPLVHGTVDEVAASLTTG
jgi:thymidine phosphorylase